MLFRSATRRSGCGSSTAPWVPSTNPTSCWPPPPTPSSWPSMSAPMLTKERSNLFVGNFYSVANDIDKSTEFDITLYHKNDDEEENLIIGFNGQSSVQLGKDVRDQLKEILKKKDHNDLYLRVSYEDKEGSPRVHDLKLALLGAGCRSGF